MMGESLAEIGASLAVFSTCLFALWFQTGNHLSARLRTATLMSRSEQAGIRNSIRVGSIR